jgi:Leucine-rich repeat (LRR) protein
MPEFEWGIIEYKEWQKIGCPKVPNILSLNLKNCGLSELDNNIDKLVDLVIIDLNNNPLTYIPNTIINLRHLNKLIVSRSQIKIIPFDILKKFKNLKIQKFKNRKFKNQL